MSKTQSALDYLASHPQATPCTAARAVKLAPSVLYRAIERRDQKKKDCCPLCGRPRAA